MLKKNKLRYNEYYDMQHIYDELYAQSKNGNNFYKFILNYICLFDYLFISSQMSAKPYFIGSTGILLLW